MSDLAKTVELMNKKLSLLVKEAKEEKVTWVKASVITSLTGWNNEKMRKGRENGYIKFKRDSENKLWYNLESLSPILYKQNQNNG